MYRAAGSGGEWRALGSSLDALRPALVERPGLGILAPRSASKRRGAGCNRGRQGELGSGGGGCSSDKENAGGAGAVGGKRSASLGGGKAPKVAPAEDDAAQALLMLL